MLSCCPQLKSVHYFSFSTFSILLVFILRIDIIFFIVNNQCRVGGGLWCVYISHTNEMFPNANKDLVLLDVMF